LSIVLKSVYCNYRLSIGWVEEAYPHFQALRDTKKSIYKKLWHFFNILLWGLIFIVLLGIAIWVVIEIYQGVVIVYQKLF